MRRTRTVVIALLVGLTVVVTTTGPGAADGNEAPGAPLAYRSISAGTSHTCAILDDGRLKCWGANGQGRLGLGDSVDRGDDPGEMGEHLPAVDLGTGRTARAVVASDTHTCALLDNGQVKCWGNNAGGLLGLEDTVNRGAGAGQMGDDLPAVDLGAGRTATAITAGRSHSCALLDNGQVKCWGIGTFGRLGYGDTDSRGGDVGDMGDDLPFVDLGTGRSAVSLSAGTDHTCAILDNATVKCWGRSEFWGMLGYEDQAARGDEPDEMGDDLPTVDLGTGARAEAVAASGYHTCVLLDTGRVKCWGENNVGQLGYGDTFHRGNIPNTMGDLLPTVPLGSGRTATAIAAGGAYSTNSPSAGGHTCALLDDGTVKCWGTSVGLPDGLNHGKQPGEMGDALPAVRLGTGRDVNGLALGRAHFCAWTSSGELKCWGDNLSGKLGLGDEDDRGDDPAEMGDALPAVDLGDTGVTGTVSRSGTTAGLSEMWVAVLRQSDFGLQTAGATGSDGRFRIATPPGEYFVYLLDPTADHVAGFLGAPTPVTVGSGSYTSEVDGAMTPTRGAVTGLVTETGSGDPIPGARVVVLNGTTGRPEIGAVTGPTGRYTISRLAPGPRLVFALDPTGAHAPRFSPSELDTSTADHPVVAAGATTSADVTLPAQAGGTGPAPVTGTVREQGTGRRLANVMVLALRDSDFSLAGATTTGGTGAYQLPLTAGSYRLAFLDLTGRHEMQWHQSQPYTGLGSATPVTAPATIDATLPATTAAIRGTVTDETLGHPLGSAWVVAIGPTGVAGGTVTAADGTYELSGLPTGTYRVTAVGTDGVHLQRFWIDSPDYDGATPISLVAPTPATADFSLPAP